MKNLEKIFLMMLLLSQLVSSHHNNNKKTMRASQPCNQFVLYLHDILFNGKNSGNATSSAATNATLIGNAFAGMLVVFDDPVTKDANLHSPPVARAQGFYFYDMKTVFNAWFGFSIVFNSTEQRGIINIMGADMMTEPTRDISVVGGTGDFFMTRGVVSFQTDATEHFDYFRVKMHFKLYECY